MSHSRRLIVCGCLQSSLLVFRKNSRRDKNATGDFSYRNELGAVRLAPHYTTGELKVFRRNLAELRRDPQDFFTNLGRRDRYRSSASYRTTTSPGAPAIWH